MFDLIAEIKQVSKLFVVFGLGFAGLYMIFTQVATQDGVTPQGTLRPDIAGSVLPGAPSQKAASKE
jgi:hypothetical protein